MTEYEFSLSTGLDYEYQIHHPYWPMQGFFLDLQTFLEASLASLSASTQEESASKSDWMPALLRLHSKATDWITQSLFTDCSFMYTSSQMGLASLWSVSQKVDCEQEEGKNMFSLRPWIDKYISYTWRSQEPERVLKLKEKLEEIGDIVDQAKPTEAAEAKRVDVKLKKCANPLHDPNSKLYVEFSFLF